MRPIKFRAWDTEKERMVPVYKVEWASGIPTCIYCDEYGDIGSSILMQFTGLLDKNGKEIYEGDILKEGLDFPPLLVRWDGWGCFETVLPSGDEFEGELFGREITDCFEVIGNIYENPELIKE